MQFDIKVITISITNFRALTEKSAAGLPTTKLKGTGLRSDNSSRLNTQNLNHLPFQCLSSLKISRSNWELPMLTQGPKFLAAYYAKRNGTS